MSIEEDILIERFLKKQLTNSEKDNVLKRIETNQSFKEKVNFERNLLDSFNEDNWSFIKNLNSLEVKKYEEAFIDDNILKIKESIFKANNNYKNRKTNKIRKLFRYSSAAVIALLISIYFLIPNNSSSEKIYYAYLNSTELPSFTSRGTDNNLIEGQKFFENKNYNNAVKIFNVELNKKPNNSNIYLYLAISQIELHQFDKSEATLDKLISSNQIDSEKGYWFKSLLFLKKNNLEECNRILNLIIKNSYYNSNKAKVLLKQLN